MSETWRDHIPEDERMWLISEMDDGSAYLFARYSGGAHALGEWGTVSVMKVEADGTTYFRDYVANSEWHDPLVDKRKQH